MLNLKHPLKVLLFCMLSGMSFSSSASATVIGIQDDYLLYKTQAGDTLEDIAKRYTTHPDNWKMLAATNRVKDPLNLSIGKTLKLHLSLLKSKPDYADISSLQGTVLINGRALSPDEEYLIREGDEIQTKANSSLSITLRDCSVVSISPNSVIVVQRLRTPIETDYLDAIFFAKQGEFTSSVEKQNGRIMRFEITTPTSIAGIRGTIIRNRTDNGNSSIELVRGQAFVNAGTSASDDGVMLNKNEGATIKSGGITKSELPPAPNYTSIVKDTHILFTIEPVKEAQSYLVRYTSDPEGLDELARFSVSRTKIALPLPDYTFKIYSQIRSVDHESLGGADKTQEIIIRPNYYPNTQTGGSLLPGAEYQ